MVTKYRAVRWITKPPHHYGTFHLTKDDVTTLCKRRVSVTSSRFEDWDGQITYICAYCLKRVDENAIRKG